DPHHQQRRRATVQLAARQLRPQHRRGHRRCRGVVGRAPDGRVPGSGPGLRRPALGDRRGDDRAGQGCVTPVRFRRPTTGHDRDGGRVPGRVRRVRRQLFRGAAGRALRRRPRRLRDVDTGRAHRRGADAATGDGAQERAGSM
ncbi:MAG: hypothetical protein AVDCRST_MAG66-3823, partial [uncultured Pseudonocardia sp.]